MTADPALHALPPKFGFLVDDGGAPSLATVAADVRFDWVAAQGTFSVGLGGSAVEALHRGIVPASDLVAEALAIARKVVTVPGEPRRIRTMIRERGVAAVAAMFGARRPEPVPMPVEPCLAGQHSVEGRPVFGLAVPFGRLDAAMLRAAAALATRVGTGELRLTPWRTILLPTAAPVSADLAALAALDFILDGDDPRLRVAACSGAAGCERGTTQTHADAAALAPFAAALPGTGLALHVSGCAKGCARPRRTALTLVGREGRYDLVHRGKAGDAPHRTALGLAAVRDAIAREVA